MIIMVKAGDKSMKETFCLLKSFLSSIYLFFEFCQSYYDSLTKRNGHSIFASGDSHIAKFWTED